MKIVILLAFGLIFAETVASESQVEITVSNANVSLLSQGTKTFNLCRTYAIPVNDTGFIGETNL